MAAQNATFSNFSKPLESFLTSDERTFLTGVYILLSFFGMLGNGIVIYVIMKLGFYVDVPGNIFILSQAFSDLGTAFSLLIYVIHMHVWIWDVFYWYTGVVWLSSLGSLFLLTFNRLLSVRDSLAYARRMTPTRAKLLVILNWILALIVTTYPLLISWSSFNFGRYYIVTVATFVVLFDVYLFREGRIQSEKIKRQINQIVTGLQNNLKEDFRSVRTLAIVGGTFMVCCLPITVVTFMFGDDKTSVQFQRNAAYTGALMPINAILDPVIYYFRSAEFRAFYQRFKRSRESNFGTPKSSTNGHHWWVNRAMHRVKPAGEE